MSFADRPAVVTPSQRITTALYGFTILLSAFLLFQIQPMISKWILPWFGGTPAVWTVCMLFFQTVLFGGYYYAHLISSRFSLRQQVVIHGALLAVSAFLVLSRSIGPEPGLKPGGGTEPTWQILWILALTVGLPYFTLATTSPLLQGWFGRLQSGREPYVFYALSNVGSLLALVSYPVLIEPWLALPTQGWIWCGGYGLFASVALVIVIGLSRHGIGAEALNAEQISGPTADVGLPRDRWIQLAWWMVLPMVASTVLLAVTNQLCMDVASVPFLWILPLSIYLLTFILTFSGWRVYNRPVCFAIIAAATLAVTYVLKHSASVPLFIQVPVYSLLLGVTCLAAHGELYWLRPAVSGLTRYYLAIAAGGALGGIFVGLVAPRIFTMYYELHLALVAIAGLMLLRCWCDPSNRSRRSRFCFLVAGTGVLICMASGLVLEVQGDRRQTVDVRRNFFGVIRVQERNREQPARRYYILYHGSTQHGIQFCAPKLAKIPITYYSAVSGVAAALAEFPQDEPKRVGVLGLGVGTIAVYAQRGDRFRFYEINPDMIDLAQNSRYFHYLSLAREAGATVEIVPGDARLSMEREAAAGQFQQFDVLVLDAFGSDSIPSHLLTREAFAVYLRHLKPTGVIAVHITNRHLRLYPVLAALARCYRLQACYFSNERKLEEAVYSSKWVLLTRNPRFAGKFHDNDPDYDAADTQSILWTDDFNNLFQVLKKRSFPIY